MKRLILLLSLFGLFWAPSSWGQGTLMYDQQSSIDERPMGGVGGFNMRSREQAGQSFTPMFSSIGFVCLKMADFPGVNDVGASVWVNLRAESMNGPILSSTDPVTMADGFNGVARFLFPHAISLTPGTSYFLEPILAPGSDDWRLEWNEFNYQAGNPFLDGAARGGDIWFREGIVAVPEPTSLLLTAAGLAAAVASHRRSRRGNKA